MRVALLSANAQAGDAIGNQLADKVAFFADHGADVRVFVESDRRLHPVVKPYCQLLTDTQLQDSNWDFIRSADLVIADYSQHYGLLEWLPLLSGSKTRVVLDYHGVTPAHYFGPNHREALDRGAEQRGLVWAADAAIFHSRFAGRELLGPTGFPPERTSSLGYAIDTGWFCPGFPSETIRSSLGLKDATLLLFVGRVAPNKRLPVLVEALARLRDADPPVHALVVGPTDDVYKDETRKCQELAFELGIHDRLHIVGRISPEHLRAAYRTADVFVMPSRHEAFCLPVLEAMASGLPVVAARAGALPETVGNAGLTFVPDDADDLARQLRRVLNGEWRLLRKGNIVAVGQTTPAMAPPRVAVVACRYGTDFAGGAERSLRTIAESLSQTGHHVEVFTTCTEGESAWKNTCSEGCSVINGVPVQRFRVDEQDREKFLAAQRTIAESTGQVPAEVEGDFLAHSLRSSELLENLRRRIGDFDAVIVGPYLFGLTFDVAREFADRVLLLPCFHDEPAARLPLLQHVYGQVGGILYHSPEEQQFAQTELGVNHPGAVCCGTWLDLQAGNVEHGQQVVGTGRRYVVYAGRYGALKNLPLLLDYARRYDANHPKRFTFALMGQGDLPIPREPWARDLGFVDDATRQDVIAGAAALVQLSCLESLSLVALEAWSQGIPVIAHRDCPVLAAQIHRSQGGRAVGGYEEFAAALDELWDEPERWQQLGQQGKDFVLSQYGSQTDYSDRLVEAIRGLRVPLVRKMRRQGRRRALLHSRTIWRERFARLVESVLDAPCRPFREAVEVELREDCRTVSAGQEAVLVPVRVVNRGTHAVAAAGPAAVVLRCRVVEELRGAGEPPAPRNSCETALPGLLLPGQTMPAAVVVPVPAAPGNYRVAFFAERAESGNSDAPETWLRLVVEEGRTAGPQRHGTPLLEGIQAALLPAEKLQRLPDDYLDVTEGWLAPWKLKIKSKLLHNFKRAYVDVVSRQQSAFNRQVLTALHELAEYCATLDHALNQNSKPEIRNPKPEIDEVLEELAESQRRCADLEERLGRLEALLAQGEEVRT